MKDIRLPPRVAGYCLLLLFIISGFSGLIYQSIWSHYLGLVLGHAAYAQSLVLAIFMGGMALGAWIVSHKISHWKRLILMYAVIEGVIGVIGLVFQSVFLWYTSFSHEVALPSISSSVMAHLYQWGTAALLIFPQCLLLGATFPLLSAGYLRIVPQEDGQILGGLYFTNSFGAACGALAATFLLLPAIGLPGSMFTAGFLNILVALGAWLVAQSVDKNQKQKGVCDEGQPSKEVFSIPEKQAFISRLAILMLCATAISGATSFVYETGWIRLLNQVFGSTVHSFEIMLAAFIFGLAFGGLWIRQKSSGITDAVRYVGYVQIFMGIAALISIPLFAQSFHWVSWIMNTLMRNENGYLLFELATASISLLVMFPAAFFAGMTLPLFTMALLRAGAGERAIGRIYAANTLGSIAGVVLMIHILIPMLGVKNSIAFAALVDAGLGMGLLYLANKKSATSSFRVSQLANIVISCVAVTMVFIGCIRWGQIDPVTQMSGVFRLGSLRHTDENRQSVYFRDGKTATIAVSEGTNGKNRWWSIATNGKPDAALTVSLAEEPLSDEITMLMLGAMPLIAHPEPKDIALIGWGSGLSTHTVLGSSVPQKVDSIEIEPAMYEGAKLFMNRVARAYNNPRSHVYFEDARTFLSMGRRSYDVIVSEPSNPWVSGVASLFTKEFYAFLKSHLNESGVLVQWLHSYELNDQLLSTMLLALVEQFPNADIYLANTTDIIIVAYKGERHPLSGVPWQEEALREELARVGLSGLPDVEFRRIGSSELVRQFTRVNGVVAHSDFFPTVSLQAPLSRFKQERSLFFNTLRTNGFPVLDYLECYEPARLQAALADPMGTLDLYNDYKNAQEIFRAMQQGNWSNINSRNLEDISMAELVFALEVLQKPVTSNASFLDWTIALDTLAQATIGALSPVDLESIWRGSSRNSWLPESVLENEDAYLLYSVYAAAAIRNSESMFESANTVLRRSLTEKNLGMPFASLENILIIGMLGAIGEEEPAKAIEMFNQYASQFQVKKTDMVLLIYSWADGMLSGSIRSCRQ